MHSYIPFLIHCLKLSGSTLKKLLHTGNSIKVFILDANVMPFFVTFKLIHTIK